jgi:hypothetical protein
MRRHRLGVFERAAVGEIGRDPGRPETVIADRRHDAGGFGAPAHHGPGIGLIHRPVGKRGRDMPFRRAEQPTFLARTNETP